MITLILQTRVKAMECEGRISPKVAIVLGRGILQEERYPEIVSI